MECHPYEEVPTQASQEACGIQVEDTLDEGLSSPPRHNIHYYVSMEDDSTF